MRMKPSAAKAAPRRATNISIRADLIEEAKKLNVNISKACEQGLEQQVRQSLREAWIEENREAMESWNKWVEENGLPLARYRQF